MWVCVKCDVSLVEWNVGCHKGGKVISVWVNVLVGEHIDVCV